ncbi:hypothetical protein [Flexivirga alba]|uniref:Amidase n=1 Tax=Flexivirga alba TaxID=702742 RepID=A0ABW2AD35_9MICO
MPPADTAAARAMWVWSGPDPEVLVDFARCKGVATLFVAVCPDVATSPDLPRLRRLTALADAVGIRLDALGGEPHWATDHAAASAWARAAAGTGLFTGIHVDVEPYALAAWSGSASRARLVRSYLGLLDALQQETHETGHTLEVDVPFWWQTVPVGDHTLADAVLTRVDAVTVMSYRDRATGPDSITAVGADLLERAAAAQRPVRLAAETNPVPDCPSCTFAGRTASELRDALAEVDRAEASTPAFAGIAVEDYDGWRALRE